MGTFDVKQDLVASTAKLGGQSLVFHCHFYNCALQAAVEAALGSDAADIQRGAAQGVVRAQLSELYGAQGAGLDQASKLALAAKLFAELGFGTLEFGTIGALGGKVVVRASHYAMGWITIYGERPKPACNFVEGFVAAAVGEALKLAPERVRVRETKCFACGADSCELDVEVL